MCIRDSARSVLLDLKSKAQSEEEKLGIEIVYHALAEPVKALARNSGLEPGVALAKMEDAKDIDFGFDAVTLEFGSMFKKGIVDPAKVVRSSLQNAASVAMTMLTTECLVTDIPEKKKDAPAGAGGMGGMGGMDGMY